MSTTDSKNSSSQYQPPHYTLSPTELQSEAERSFQAAFMEFDNLVNPYSLQKYFCFVEGYDRDYYYSPVTSILGKDNEFINCRRKKNVIRMHSRISNDENYSSVKTLYFVDKDYDDNSKLGSDFFITDYYSIENYYCSELFLENVLKNVCHVDYRTEKERVQNIMNDFAKWKTDFYNITKDFCAWYRDAKNRLVEDSPKDYKEHFPPKFANIKHSGMSKKISYTYESLNDYYKIDPPVSQAEYSVSLTKINGIEDIRGKFVIEFMDIYLKHLDNQPKGSPLGKGWGYHSNRKTFLSTFSGCSEISDKLREYIYSRK